MTDKPEPESEWPAWLVVGLIVILLAFLYTFRPARAHDHNHPELNGWFKTLHSHSGSLCCDGSDAISVLDPDWETQNKEDSHFRVRIDVSQEAGKVDMEWVDVPDSAIVDVPNEAGITKVWPYFSSPSGGPTRVYIRCFLPGNMS